MGWKDTFSAVSVCCSLTCPVCYSQWNSTICIDRLVPLCERLGDCKGAAVWYSWKESVCTCVCLCECALFLGRAVGFAFLPLITQGTRDSLILPYNVHTHVFKKAGARSPEQVVVQHKKVNPIIIML